MYTNPSPEDRVSQYPDPEQSGLSFPWLDQYQPVAADNLSVGPQFIIYEGFVPREDVPTTTADHGLENPTTTSSLPVEDGLPQSSAALQDSDEDLVFGETDGEAESVADLTPSY